MIKLLNRGLILLAVVILSACSDGEAPVPVPGISNVKSLAQAGAVQLTWSYSGTQPDGFVIFRKEVDRPALSQQSESMDSWHRYAEVAGDVRQFEDKNVLSAITYAYAVALKEEEANRFEQSTPAVAPAPAGYEAEIIAYELLTPSSEKLKPLDWIEISLQFRNNVPDGVYIWAIPINYEDPEVSLPYAASQLIMDSEGTVTRSGTALWIHDETTVDAFRLRIANRDHSEYLFDVTIPVSYTYSPLAQVMDIRFDVDSPATIPVESNVYLDIDYDIPEEYEQVFVRVLPIQNGQAISFGQSGRYELVNSGKGTARRWFRTGFGAYQVERLVITLVAVDANDTWMPLWGRILPVDYRFVRPEGPRFGILMGTSTSEAWQRVNFHAEFRYTNEHHPIQINVSGPEGYQRDLDYDGTSTVVSMGFGESSLPAGTYSASVTIDDVPFTRTLDFDPSQVLDIPVITATNWVGDTDLLVTWQRVEGAAMYDIRLREFENYSWSTVGTETSAEANSVRFFDLELDATKQYELVVIAVSEVNRGSVIYPARQVNLSSAVSEPLTAPAQGSVLEPRNSLDMLEQLLYNQRQLAACGLEGRFSTIKVTCPDLP